MEVKLIGSLNYNKVSEILKDYKFDIIYSSPLSRALTTAQIVNKYHNVEIITDDRLKEYNVGSRQGEVFGKEWKSIFSSESINEVIACEIHKRQGYRNHAAYELMKIHHKEYLLQPSR